MIPELESLKQEIRAVFARHGIEVESITVGRNWLDRDSLIWKIKTEKGEEKKPRTVSIKNVIVR